MTWAWQILSLTHEDFGRMNKDEIRISNEELFKGESTRFWLRTIESQSKISVDCNLP